MRKRGKIYEISQFAIIFFWIIFTASAADAELRIESVTPDQGVAGQELAVMITGTGFDENTRVSVYMDRVLGNVETPDYYANGIALSGNFAFVTDYESLQVVDVNDPQNPAIIGSLDTGGYVHGVALSGDLVFVTNGGSGLQVVDVSDPHNPAIIGSVDTPGSAYAVALSGDLAFVAASREGLQVVDVSDPHHPTIIASVDTPDSAYGVTLSGGLAFVADNGSGLQVVDVSDPHNPVIIGSVDTPSSAQSVALSGNLAFVTDDYSGLHIWPVPAETPSVTASSETEISLTLPGPTYAGEYTLRVFNGMENSVLSGAVNFAPCVKGDLSGDGETGLADAILALQTLTGTEILPACAVSFIDVNDDGKIGLAEVIYILLDVAGMR